MVEELFQPTHLIVILAIPIGVFGQGNLPEMGPGTGKSTREFKKALSEESKPLLETSMREDTDNETKKTA
jgi:TatA/E family protein of Tat protein translocase